MAWLPLCLAAAVALPPGLGATFAAAKRPELVTVPMATLGTGAGEALEAWDIVKEALAQSKEVLSVSVALQKARHDFLVGPAREQVKDCSGSPDCLKEIGAALGADVLVTGFVTPAKVSLVAVEVATGRVVGESESPPELAKADLASRANAASRLLIASMGGAPAPSALLEDPEPEPLRPGPDPTPVVGEGDLKGFDEAPPEPTPADPNADPVISGVAPEPLPDVKNPMQGRLRIAPDQLRGVSEIQVDGGTAPFSGDGSVEWAGAPGDHTLVAVSADGARLRRNVFLEPGSVTNVVLDFPELGGSPPPPPPGRGGEGESVITKWWFWTSVGAAVAAGATVAAVLVGGTKGGPSFPDETGAITGTY
ncbi:MAG: hypothetical protein H6730_20850 [Deltaproteobacteria bacterium]|nr:hypothetical protein [Deltaproteobacteria bacterium]